MLFNLKVGIYTIGYAKNNAEKIESINITVGSTLMTISTIMGSNFIIKMTGPIIC
jgi:hypothetical protein